MTLSLNEPNDSLPLIERKIVEAEFSLKLSIGSLVKLDKRFGPS